MKSFFRSLFLILFSITIFSCKTTVQEVHHHSFSEEWTFDQNHHWHESTCGCGEEIIEKIPHSFDDGTVTTEPTLSKEGIKTYYCLDCEFSYTETLPKHSHNYPDTWIIDETSHWHAADCGIDDHRSMQGTHWWDNGTITLAPTQNDDGIKTYTCQVCNFQKTEVIAKLSHTHTYASEYSSDSKYHWHETDCDHSGIKKDFEPHKWANLKVTNPTESKDGKNEYTCQTCGTKYSETLHRFDFKKWESNAYFHWNPSVCSHGAQANLSFHNFYLSSQDDKNCTYTCSICQYSITEARNTYISDTLLLELPVCSGFSDTDPYDHQVRTFHYYTICYRESYEESEWSAYKLTREDLNGTADRKNNFVQDNAILTGTVSDSVYKNTGFQKGHLTPAGDMTRNSDAMYDSFYISNICPQYSSLNTGKWSTLESKVREWCNSFGQVYVVSGPILERLATEYDSLGTNDKIIIPEYFYKVIFTYKTNNDGTYTPMSIGFVMPNQKCDADLFDYAVSVDSIEERTGLDFFSALDDATENLIESSFDAAMWK